MKDIAFLILAHTDPKQLARLTQAINFKSHIFIHLDRKSNIDEFRNQNFPENVTLLENRVPVSWAAYSQVEATLRMMSAALKSNNKFSHLVLLSGLDYPIKPVWQLHSLLNANPEHEYIRFVDVTNSNHYRVFFEYYWFLKVNPWLPAKLDRNLRHGFGRVLRQIVKKPQPSRIKVCWGSAYWALTPACAEYILDYTIQNPDFVNWAKSSFAVDEHFFHTIIANSEYVRQTDGFSLYQGNKTYLTANLHLIHESMRKVYSACDFDELACSDKFFVRKVTSDVSTGLINRIDRELLDDKLE